VTYSCTLKKTKYGITGACDQGPGTYFYPLTSLVHGKCTKESVRINDHSIFMMELEDKVVGHAQKRSRNKFNLSLRR
jgi:hypothetical protein